MNQVDIVNMALAQIGARAQVSSITPPDGSAESIQAGLLYQPMIDNLMRAAHWNFTRKEIDLTLLSAAKGTPENVDGTLLPIPPRPWLYAYAHPSDCLKERFVLPSIPADSTGVPFTTADVMAVPTMFHAGSVDFAVGLDEDSSGADIKVVLTNMSGATMVYTKRVSDVNLWDASFVIAASSYLGAWLVNALARNRALWTDQMKVAMDIVTSARINDGNEGVTVQDHLPDWMRVRGLTGFGLPSFQIQGFDALSWPNGSML